MVDYSTDLLKHYVRYNGWLPFCRGRKQLLAKSQTKVRNKRGLRYFTFCAVGAMDVLMLSQEGIINTDPKQPFKMVTFFDRTDDLVEETRRRIPGARGFIGEFVSLMLSKDAADLDSMGLVDVNDVLQPPLHKEDTLANRDSMRRSSKVGELFNSFPYDIINLDLQGYMFRPKDEFPGKMLKALRHVMKWQRRPVHLKVGSRNVDNGPLEGFTLMFTTPIGPTDLEDEYLDLLKSVISDNVDKKQTLKQVIEKTVGSSDPVTIHGNSFETFFKLSVPKQLARTILEFDWYVEPDPGIKLFCFERPCQTGTYKILHFVMHVSRQTPDMDHRGSTSPTDEAEAAYNAVAESVFSLRVDNVSLDGETGKLENHLRQVRALGDRYAEQ